MNRQWVVATRLGAATLTALTAVAALGTAAHADVTVGGSARTFAMGGAGLAIADGTASAAATARVNPASLALAAKGIGVTLPSVGVKADGLTVAKAFDAFSSGKVGADSATDLAREFGSRDSELGVVANTALRFGAIEIGAGGVARGRLLPNASTRNWVDSGANTNRVPLDARADLIAAGVYALPSVGVAGTIPGKNGAQPIHVGVRIKAQRAVYSHYFIDATNFVSGSDAFHAPEMNGKNTLEKSGLGIDVGFLTRPKRANGLTAAVVVTNLIQPSLTFRGTDVNGASRTYDLQPTTFSLGTAFRQGPLLLAADLVDLGSGIGSGPEARLGGEIKQGNFALRGGYASRTGFTYGFGIAGIDIALGKRAPVEITQNIRF